MLSLRWGQRRGALNSSAPGTRQERHGLKTLRSRGHRVLLAVLAEVRQEPGPTLRALATRLKMPHSYPSKVETGERRIDPVECMAWAKACGLDPVDFFTRFVDGVGRRV